MHIASLDVFLRPLLWEKHPCKEACVCNPSSMFVLSPADQGSTARTLIKPRGRMRHTAQLYTRDHGSFDKRIFGCLVLSPSGRAIWDLQSIPELLKTLRDAVKAHRSLYINGKILHRDISGSNIIITDPKEADGFRGMLIDEDLAKEICSGRSGARHQTGTMEFMAIEVLQWVAHSYRHDLESFSYVLLWTCARRAWEKEFQCKSRDRPKEKSML